MRDESSLHTLQKWLKDSQHTVVLTGAGMSTESGLPDFRSNQGLWHGKDPQEIASTYALQHNREEFVDFYRWRIRELEKYDPHTGHEILARWQRQGLLHRVITQNVDGFHNRAGSYDTIELHGSLQKVYCQECGASYAAQRYTQEGGEECPGCGGLLRPGIVLFGEMLDEHAITQAIEEARRTDLLIVMGSSLQVSPANLLPLETKANGGKFAVMNKEPTDMDAQADLVILGKIGPLLVEIGNI